MSDTPNGLCADCINYQGGSCRFYQNSNAISPGVPIGFCHAHEKAPATPTADTASPDKTRKGTP